jgi:sulfite exporter TauE/SafE
MISAFLIGFTGSFHCVGMCGPIALSLPGNGQAKWMTTSLYLAGKTLTYTALGFIFGIFGRQLSISGLQQALSIIAGISLLLVVVVMVYNPLKYHENILTTWISDKLLPLFKVVLANRSKATPLYMGVLNGLLPCGLVYLGVVGSLATGSVLHGGLFMLSFGLGTMPVMLSFLLMAKQFNINYRKQLSRLAPVLISMIGVLLILRGLNLGIPYVSPAMDAMPAGSGLNAVGCH